MERYKDLEVVTIKKREDLRKWLKRHYTQKESIWLGIYKKHVGEWHVPYEEIVEEALCFGWIDSKANKWNDEQYLLLFSPRKPKSVWSKVNKRRIEQLMATGQMTDAGLAKINAAKADGSWETLDATENLVIPDGLKGVLQKNKTALKNFEAFPPSTKKNIYWWIESAKTDTTKQKRIMQTVDMAEQNLKANQYQKKN
ncbi:MAG: YdeI/OmpD-associated family protein [Chitinophagales bacterium]|nr:YdeI/OmpD-associated family protein [Chitinophagales bacterium]